MPTYTIRLSGPGVPGAHRLPAPIVRDLLDAFDRGARGALRLRLEGRSSAPGPTPGWLERAARFDLALEPDTPDRAVRLVAPALRDVMPDRFPPSGGALDPLAEETSVSLFTSGLADAVRGRTESDAFDEGLLRSLRALGKVFDRNVELLEIRNGLPDAPVLDITRAAVRTAERLYERVPRAQRVRVAGRLDEVRYSDRAFSVLLEDGASVRGVLTNEDGSVLREHSGRVVAVSGLAHFKPSGALRVVEADRIAPATDGDLAVFSEVPRSMFAPLGVRALRVPQGPGTGVSAIFGTWPGDETDEEFERILDELS